MNNIPVLVQIMAWHQSDDKSLSESMLVSLLMHICVTRSQWVNMMVLMWLCVFVMILTLNMLNCFEDYKICIHISYHILDFIQQKKIKVSMEQPYVLPILYCQYHACWCTGDFRSQCISRHGIDLQSRNIPSLASEELIAISISRFNKKS